MTKRDWMKKSTITVMLGTSLIMSAPMGQASASTDNSAQAEQIVALTKSLVGKDYRYRANGPTAFGSANLATYVYEKAGIEIEDTIAELYRGGIKVDKNSLKAGDLVFFASDGEGAPTYMGVYIGDNRFIYSSQKADEVVSKSFSQYEDKFVGARRYLEQKVEPSDAGALADRIIQIGEKYLGTPYKYGSSKDTTRTFDCSSFTQRVFREAGITLPRDSRQQSAVGTSVSLKTIKKGDLVFMKASVSSDSDRITHVAIYAGNGKILHTYGEPGVTYSKFWGTNWEKRVVKVKRVIPE